MDKKTLMAKASGKIPAETVFKNGKIINVFTSEIETFDIAVEAGMIIGIGNYEGETTIDLKGAYLAPGLIDGHVHIESAMVTPPHFASIVLPKGTTSIIADPHEIANVSGIEGIEFMLKAAEKSPLDVYMMIPSSVPATDFETSGAKIGVEDILAMRDQDGILGLGEVMNYPGVLAGEKDIHAKIETMRNRVIDGHAPSLKGNDINAYKTAGVMTDHECSTVEEMLDRLKRGMYVHLREGSVTRNVNDLLKGVTPGNWHRVLFCTDDKHPEDIKKEGHINYNINLAIKQNIPAIEAIKMATLNAANCYRLHDKGAIAPGYQADFFTFDSLEKIEAKSVYKNGKLVAKDNQSLYQPQAYHDDNVLNTMHINPDDVDFSLPLKNHSVKVIGLIKNNITTKKLKREVKIKDGLYQNDRDQDILKLACIERHQNTAKTGLGFIEGFGIKNGAIAMSIAHDSHNIIIAGDSDEAMRLALNKIVALGGGIVLVANGKIKDYLKLEISGIMTQADPKDVADKLDKMKQDTRNMGLSKEIDDPFIQLAFLSLAVIPELKLTDKGLFDVNAFKNVKLEWEVD